MFLSLEALVIGLASASPTPEGVERLDALEGLAKERDAGLHDYVKRLRERCSAPGLGERFRRLAERLFPDDSAGRLADVEVFEKLNWLRNRLLHPSRHYWDLSLAERERASQATVLAQRYLLAAFTQG
jgi:hypothetical protein